MRRRGSALAHMSEPARSVTVGAAVLGGLGAPAGLVIGLVVHPPTAWFALLEVGVPAAAAGAALGLLAGTVTLAIRRRRHAQAARYAHPR